MSNTRNSRSSSKSEAVFQEIVSKEEASSFNLGANIKVIGVGGGGGNAIAHMVGSGIKTVEFIAANTDAQALRRTSANRCLQLGKSGLGAGAKPEVGRDCAIEAEEDIRNALEGAQMLFVTTGLGGGTGTGAAPVIAKIAREMGILTVGVVTKPFDFEGSRRCRTAEAGLAELEPNVDSLIVVLNEKLLEVLGDDVSQEDAFAAANNVLLDAVGGITNIIQEEGLVNVDFEDVRTVMSQPGRAMMGSAMGTGPDRATKAAEHAVACPLLEGIDLSCASGVLVLVTASRRSLKLAETRSVVNIVRRYAAEDAHLIMGTSYSDDLGDSIRVTVIATGLNVGNKKVEKKLTLVSNETAPRMNMRESMSSPAELSSVGQSSTSDRGKSPFGRAASRVTPTRNASASVWTGRSVTANRSAVMQHPNMDELEIPAFLRKQAD